MMDTQQEIDAMAEALRSQGLTWSQTNFAVSLVRNAAAAERERWAATFAQQSAAIAQHDAPMHRGYKLALSDMAAKMRA